MIKCPLCKRKLKSLNVLKYHIRTHSKSIIVLTPLEYKIYLELKRRGLNPCFPSHIREITNYKWSRKRCQWFLRKLGYKRELGYDLKQLTLFHRGNGFVVVRVIE